VTTPAKGQIRGSVKSQTLTAAKSPVDRPQRPVKEGARMRRIVIAALGTVTALVLLFSYNTSQNRGTSTISAVGPAGGGDASSAANEDSGGQSEGTGDKAAAGSGGKKKAKGKTFTGDEIETKYGPVQVEITVSKGKITKAEAVTFPTGTPKHEEVNSRALPILNDEVIDAQNAEVDAVSGATSTSEGYVESLQAAIDAANL
jgi:uncharacterized protein with FMN-binding domain